MQYIRTGRTEKERCPFLVIGRSNALIGMQAFLLQSRTCLFGHQSLIEQER